VVPDWRAQGEGDDGRFLPAGYPSGRGYLLLEKTFSKDVFASRAVFSIDRPASPLTSHDFSLVDRITPALKALMRDEAGLQMTSVVSHREPLIGNRLVSADRQCALIQVSLGMPYTAAQTRITVDRAESVVRPFIAAAGPTAPRLFVTGPSGIGRDLIAASAK